MTSKEIRIMQLKTRNNFLREYLHEVVDYPYKHNETLNEIKLNEEIIKFLER